MALRCTPEQSRVVTACFEISSCFINFLFVPNDQRLSGFATRVFFRKGTDLKPVEYFLAQRASTLHLTVMRSFSRASIFYALRALIHVLK